MNLINLIGVFYNFIFFPHKKIMKKEDLLQLTGTQLSCAPDCQIGHQCFGGWVNENPECNKGVNDIQKLFNNKGYMNLIITQGLFGIRVFDSFSKQRPLPVIGTILIKNGNLKLRKE